MFVFSSFALVIFIISIEIAGWCILKYIYHYKIDQMYTVDPYYGYNLKAGYSGDGVTINSLGYKNDEFSIKKSEGTKRVFVLGGSTTMGSDLKNVETYPYYLNNLLKSYGYEVINAGVGGWHTYHHLLRLKKEIVNYEPDILIFFVGWNDFGVAGKLGDTWTSRTTTGSGVDFKREEARQLKTRIKIFLYKYSSTALLLRRWVGPLFVKKFKPSAVDSYTDVLKRKDVFDTFEDRLDYFVQFAKSNNCSIYFLLYPFDIRNSHKAEDETAFRETYPNNWDDARNWKDSYLIAQDLLHNRIKNIKDKYPDFVNLIDARTAFESIPPKKRIKLFADIVHFTPDGNKLLAEIISSCILEKKGN